MHFAFFICKLEKKEAKMLVCYTCGKSTNIAKGFIEGITLRKMDVDGKKCYFCPRHYPKQLLRDLEPRWFYNLIDDLRKNKPPGKKKISNRFDKRKI